MPRFKISQRKSPEPLPVVNDNTPDFNIGQNVVPRTKINQRKSQQSVPINNDSQGHAYAENEDSSAQNKRHKLNSNCGKSSTFEPQVEKVTEVSSDGGKPL